MVCSSSRHRLSGNYTFSYSSLLHIMQREPNAQLCTKLLLESTLRHDKRKWHYKVLGTCAVKSSSGSVKTGVAVPAQRQSLSTWDCHIINLFNNYRIYYIFTKLPFYIGKETKVLKNWFLPHHHFSWTETIIYSLLSAYCLPTVTKNSLTNLYLLNFLYSEICMFVIKKIFCRFEEYEINKYILYHIILQKKKEQCNLKC